MTAADGSTPYLREYASEDDFLAELAHPQLGVSYARVGRMRFPLFELGLRALLLARLIALQSVARPSHRRGID